MLDDFNIKDYNKGGLKFEASLREDAVYDLTCSDGWTTVVAEDFIEANIQRHLLGKDIWPYDEDEMPQGWPYDTKGDVGLQ